MSLALLAFDLGAESGRAILGRFNGERITLEEIYRFPNEPVLLYKSIHWDVLRIFHEIKRSLGIAYSNCKGAISSLGIDTWGVDFCLLDKKDNILYNPYHYRDRRTEGIMEEAFKTLSKREIFKRTGIQFIRINTLYQLLAMKKENSAVLNITGALLMMPDLFNFLLTGEKFTEFTMATTTQLYNPFKMDWDRELLSIFDLPVEIFQEIIPPCTVIGKVYPRVAQEIDIGEELQVIAPLTHDTASAVAIVPLKNINYAFISSGTWSVVGTKVSQPVVDDLALELNFSNSGGLNDFLFLKNTMGLWLLQECRRSWEKKGEHLDYNQLIEIAQESRSLGSLIDPDDERFLSPRDMPLEIQRYCQETGQLIPQTKGEMILCILESIALRYRNLIEELEKIINKKLPVIYMVGGGVRNKLLNQFTANATKRMVITGPTEATAVGNIISQMITLRELSSLEEAQELIGSSFHLQEYKGFSSEYWDDLYEKFLKLRGIE
ncbi:rhamnulokinase [bacterium]|nr:rhamnulokinase [bacterium]